jgi:hypothetical protein
MNSKGINFTKKYLTSFLIILAVILNTITFNAVAFADNELTVSVSSLSAVQGQSVSFEIAANNASGMAGVQFSLNYNNQTVTNVQVSQGSGISSGWIFDSNDLGNGKIQISAASGSGLTSNDRAVIAKVTFTVAQNTLVGNYPLTISDLAAFDGTPVKITAAAQNGSLTVSAPVSPQTPTPSATVNPSPTPSMSPSPSPSVKPSVSPSSRPAAALDIAVDAKEVNGLAKATVTKEDIIEVLNDKNNANKKDISIDVNSKSSNVSLTLDNASVKLLTENKIEKLNITTESVNISFDKQAFSTLTAQTTQDLSIKIAPVEVKMLSQQVQSLVGNRPVYDLSVTTGNKTISDFGGGEVTVSIPYTLAPGEDENAIVIYYINSNGEFTPINNGHYDKAAGKVVFTTTHFSMYAVANNKIAYSDVSGWAEPYITFLAARNVINGVGNNKFAPQDKLTRAQVISMLARLSSIKLQAPSKTSFSDVSKDEWYCGAVEWAVSNGIVKGSGKDKTGKEVFEPLRNVTREELAVMIDRYITYIKANLSKTNETLTFKDDKDISTWAKASIALMQQTGIMTGSTDNSINPKGNATRAEAAAMLTRIIKR